MAPLKVFADMMSQPTRSVILLLKANKIPFTTKIIHVARGMNHTDKEFGEATPNKKVPTIQDGDFTLFECTAIMRYICNKYNLPDHWYPADLQKRSKVDEYLSWHHTNLRGGPTDIIWGKVFGPRIRGRPVDERQIERGQTQVARAIKIYNDYFLKDTPFITSDKITIADLLAVCEFSQFEVLPPNFVDLSLKVEEWLARCRDTLGAGYHDTHSILYRVKAAINEASKL